MPKPKDKIFTLSEITDLWSEYSAGKVLRVMRGGKWEFIPMNGKGIPRIEGTRAEVVDLKKIMPFPKFLETR